MGRGFSERLDHPWKEIITQNFMSQKNKTEAETPIPTTDFLPSDGASCCASDFMDASFKLGAEYESLNYRVDQMMKKRGWKYTCKTPGSIWLWEKTMSDGRVILTDRGTAGMLEEQMCHEDSLHNVIEHPTKGAK
jgi:hypothetical protein